MFFLSHHRINLIAITIAAITLGACGGSTTIEQSWTAPNARAERLHKVVTLFISEDGATRRAAEDKLALDLMQKGVQATPAYALLSDQELQDLNAAKQKLAQLGYDGVVTMRLVDKEHELQYMPGDFDAYWGLAWYEPGYAYTETIVRMETNAYSLRSNRLVWSALSKTVDPSGSKGLIKDVSKVVAEQLTKRGLAG
jgi:hypothetical protein